MTPLDRVNQLINNINTDISSELYSLQSIFDKYCNEFEELKTLGINHTTIYKQGEFKLSEKHFMNLVNRAKKKKNNKKIASSEVVDTQSNATKENRVTPTLAASYDEKTKQKQTQHEVNPKIISHFSEADWKAIGIHNEYLISILQETDLTPDEVKSWNCPNQVQLSSRISEYRQRKMKRK
ncbi:hypothetical protein [Vibrio diabolicus]